MAVAGVETAPAPPPARERILESACDLIASDGIDEVRIARVARRAGASTALVHHYFSTREELLEQALLHSFDRVAEDRFGDGAEPDRDPGDTATERLARVIDECLPLPGIQEREWVLWVELWLRAVRDPRCARWRRSSISATASGSRRRSAPGSRAASSPPPTPDALADRVIALARRPRDPGAAARPEDGPGTRPA